MECMNILLSFFYFYIAASGDGGGTEARDGAAEREDHEAGVRTGGEVQWRTYLIICRVTCKIGSDWILEIVRIVHKPEH